MSDRALTSFWIPALAAVGFLLLGVPFLDLTPGVAVWAVPTGIGLGLALLTMAGMFIVKVKTSR
jgi:hypothetical protein